MFVPCPVVTSRAALSPLRPLSDPVRDELLDISRPELLDIPLVPRSDPAHGDLLDGLGLMPITPPTVVALEGSDLRWRFSARFPTG